GLFAFRRGRRRNVRGGRECTWRQGSADRAGNRPRRAVDAFHRCEASDGARPQIGKFRRAGLLPQITGAKAMTAIISEETRLRDEICEVGKSLFDRRLTFGSTGNISARLSDGTTLMTPTNASLGSLDPGRLSKFTAEGVFVDGDKPTKESFLHECMYCRRKSAGAVVHLHSTHSVAVSILGDVDPDDVL